MTDTSSRSALDALLVDPETHEPLERASRDQLEKLAWALREGRARSKGGALPSRIDGAFLSHGGRWVYPDVDGLASLLIEERLELDEPL